MQTKSQVVGSNKYHQRVEKNMVYLFSEFIDNAKSSYEKLGFVNENNSILITFNKMNGYISIKDYAEGFDTVIGLTTIGGNHQKQGETNEHGLGMKDAMNYFGDYSFIVSERLHEGHFKREMSYQVFKNNILSSAAKLVPQKKCGSEVFLFANQESFRKFIANQEFIDKSELDFLSSYNFNITDEFHSEAKPSYTQSILDDIEIGFPIISSFLFERYKYTVNKYENNNFKINFSVLGYDGEDMVEDGSIRDFLVKKEVSQPEFFKSIIANNYDSQNSFSFEELKKQILSSEYSKFVELLKDSETNKQVMTQLENFFIEESIRHYKKIENSKSIMIQKNIMQPWQINYEISVNKYEFANEYWENYNFAKNMLEPLFSGIISMKDDECQKPYEIAFNIPNLAIIDKKIQYKNIEKEFFNLKFKFFVSSSYQINNLNNSEKNYKIFNNKDEAITGLQIIKNSRAIFHGLNNLNFSMKESIYKKIISFGGQPPERFLKKEFFNIASKNNAFPKTEKVNEFGEVSGSGNNAQWSKRLFGEIVIPDYEYFSTFANKATFADSEILSNYVMELIGLSSLNVVTRFIHVIDNAIKTNKKSKNFFIETIIRKITLNGKQKNDSEKNVLAQDNATTDVFSNIDHNSRILIPENEVSKSTFVRSLEDRINFKEWNFDNTFLINIEDFITKVAMENGMEILIKNTKNKITIAENDDEYMISFGDKHSYTYAKDKEYQFKNKLSKIVYREIVINNLDDIFGDKNEW